MARISTEVASGICPHCKTRMKIERPAIAWGLGDFLLTLATLGLWLVVRNLMKGSWRCSACGAVAPKS